MTMKNAVFVLGLAMMSSWAVAGDNRPDVTTESVPITYEVIGKRIHSESGDMSAPKEDSKQWKTIRVSPDKVDETMERLRKDSTIGEIEKGLKIRGIMPVKEVIVNPGVSASSINTEGEATSFNDPLIDEQRSWRSSSRYEGAHNTEEAMKIFNPTEKTDIGVIDGGFAETNDLTYSSGANFLRGARSSEFREPAIDPGCDYRHGTKVAHVAGAQQNNGTAIAGVANARIHAVRALDCDGGGLSTDMSTGIRWLSGGSIDGYPSRDNPVDVINISISGSSAECPGHLQSAIDYAEKQGVVIIAAAGNQSENVSGRFLSNCEGVISVGANTLDGEEASFSNYGEEVGIYAFGDGVFTMNEPGTYIYASGTSFAAPIVAGHAALIKEQDQTANTAKVKSLLLESKRRLKTGERGADVSGKRILDSVSVAEAAIGGSNSEAFGHALFHEDRASLVSAYTLDKVGIAACHLYEVDTAKMNISRPDDYFYKVFEVPDGQAMTINNGSVVTKSQGDRVLVREDIDTRNNRYGLGVCDDTNRNCVSRTLIDLKSDQALTGAFCP